MEKHQHYIQSYCRIRGCAIQVNGKPFLNLVPSVSTGDFLKSAYRHLNIDYPKFHKMDGLCKAIFIAVELMARESGPYQRDTALIFSNRSSSHLSDSRHATGIFDTINPVASPSTFVYTLPNIAMGEISIRHQLQSENVFFIFDSYLPEFLVPFTASMLEDGKAGSVLCGWTEITAETCDLLLYHVGISTGPLHNVEQLKRLYNEEDE